MGGEDGASGESSLGLPAPHFCPGTRGPTCACRPRPGFTLQSGLCFSLAWPSADHSSQAPRGRCSQTAMGQAWEAARAREGPPPPPGWVKETAGAASQPKSPAPPWVALRPGESGLPPLSLHKIPRPHRRTTQLPRATSQVRTPTPDWGALLNTPRDRGRPAATAALRWSLCCALKTHPLWSRQAALHQGGQEASETETAPLPAPARGLREQAEQSCLYLHSSWQPPC